MDITEKLGLWGATHARARSLERAAQEAGTDPGDLQQQARQARQHADRLHREIYEEMGSKPERRG